MDTKFGMGAVGGPGGCVSSRAGCTVRARGCTSSGRQGNYMAGAHWVKDPVESVCYSVVEPDGDSVVGVNGGLVDEDL